MSNRVIVYIDGFNLYHAVDELEDNTLKWLDLWKLGESFCDGESCETLSRVYYFTAYATWLPAAYKRHREYVKALRSRGVEPIIGNFKSKPAKCRSCKKTWFAHEEKETDVHIAVQIIHDAHMKNYDHAILITGDSDQAPTVKRAKEINPSAKFSIWTPPNRFKGCDSLGKRKEIRKARIERCLLPDHVFDQHGTLIVDRPSKYASA